MCSSRQALSTLMPRSPLFVSVFVSLPPILPLSFCFLSILRGEFPQRETMSGQRCLFTELRIKTFGPVEPLCLRGEWPGLFQTNFHRFNSEEPRFPDGSSGHLLLRSVPKCHFSAGVSRRYVSNRREMEKKNSRLSRADGSYYRGYLMHFGPLNR